MAKLSAIKKNLHRQELVKRMRRKREELKKTVMNRSLSLDQRIQATFKLAKLPRNSAAGRVRNRCKLTGRPRAYYNKFGLSRIALRELGSAGLIPGLIKSSW